MVKGRTAAATTVAVTTDAQTIYSVSTESSRLTTVADHISPEEQTEVETSFDSTAATQNILQTSHEPSTYGATPPTNGTNRTFEQSTTDTVS